jgi:hypothetical protein
MKGKSMNRTLRIESFEGNKDEHKRALYILAFLQTGQASFARKVSGLSRMAHQRIVSMIAARGHAFDVERPGRPVTYHPAILEAACNFLVTHQESFLNGSQLRQKLVQEGILHASSKRDIFMQHLRECVMSRGHRLITNSVKTTFFISRSDSAVRLEYAHAMLEMLRNTKSIDNLIFIDETTLEESPHPKGEWIEWCGMERGGQIVS